MQQGFEHLHVHNVTQYTFSDHNGFPGYLFGTHQGAIQGKYTYSLWICFYPLMLITPATTKQDEDGPKLIEGLASKLLLVTTPTPTTRNYTSVGHLP